MRDPGYAPFNDACTAFKVLCGAMAYQVWRSMRGRPQFQHIADTRVYWYANVLVFFLAITFKAWLNDPSLTALFDGIFFTGVFALAANNMTTKMSLSRVPAASAMGASAGFIVLSQVVSLVLLFLELNSLIAITTLLTSIACALATFSILNSFKKMPKVIQKPGYRPDTFEL